LIEGLTTTVDTQNLSIEDAIVEIGRGNDGGVSGKDVGFLFTRNNGTNTTNSNVALIYDESTDRLTFGYSDGSPTDSTLAINTSKSLDVVIPSGNLGIGTASPVSILHVRGTGQTSTTSFDTSQTLGASIFAESSDSVPGSGGSLVLGTYQGKFAAIKADIKNGTSNTVGNLHFMTRNATGDATLTNRMTITNTGNVGIGTVSPRALLDVSGPVDVPAILTSGASSSEGDIAVLSGEAMQIGHWDNGTSTFTNRIHINSIGNVGIGTASPDGKLDIYTGSASTVALSFDRYASGNYRTDIYQNQYGPDFRVGYNTYTPESVLYLKRFSNGTKEVEINGNVGIGSASPGAKLDINAGSSGVNITGPTQGNSGGPNNDPWAGLKLTRLGTNGETYNGDVALRAYRWATSGADPAMALDINMSSTQPYNRNTVATFRSNGNVGIGTVSPAKKLDVNGSFYSTLNSSTANYSFYNNIGSDGVWRSAFSIGSTAIGIFTVMSYSAGYSQVSAIWWYQYKAGGTSGYVSRISGSTSPDFRLNGQTVEHTSNGGTHFTELRVFPFAI
jgi:hypothetical protein